MSENVLILPLHLKNKFGWIWHSRLQVILKLLIQYLLVFVVAVEVQFDFFFFFFFGHTARLVGF